MHMLGLWHFDLGKRFSLAAACQILRTRTWVWCITPSSCLCSLGRGVKRSTGGLYRVPINEVVLHECFRGWNLDIAVSCVFGTFSKQKVRICFFSLWGVLGSVAASSIYYVSRLVLHSYHLHQLQPILNNKARSNSVRKNVIIHRFLKLGPECISRLELMAHPLCSYKQQTC